MSSQPRTTPNPATSKVLGALLGVHAGDSLGATLEFKPWRMIRTKYPNGLREIIGGGSFGWPAGHATDDTDLTRAVLLAYLDRSAHAQTHTTATPAQPFDLTRTAADHCLSWYNGDWPGRTPGSSPRDIGGATDTGLSNYEASGNPLTSGAGPDSAGNGSLMRCVATGLFTAGREDRIKESKAISAITHNDVRCTISCAVYNEMVAALLAGKTPAEAVQIGCEVASELDCPAVEAALRRGEEVSLEQFASEGPASDFPDWSSGYVLQSLSLAVAALLDARSFEDVLVDVVRIGGDTDTNGAIAGGLLGAREGVEGIPERWLEKLQFREEFEEGVRKMLG
ncbi:ADP-ribosylation/Crystallin J1 [Massariosphaeria phaeospora]|uniref:ADP-ribosylhydrolase ARH3 n=1 Tax=Massariosphaeria phaeospora TaxID=100035 RepID=A0A7C8IP70_9PLEO|nr:ADP-ribosylation/Crystallin J1 [Massariosphaeria phaeospora]